KIDNATAQLEGTYGRVVLVLHDDFHTGQRLEQRPGILWRRRDGRANQPNHVVKLSEWKHLGRATPPRVHPSQLESPLAAGTVSRSSCPLTCFVIRQRFDHGCPGGG